MSTIECCMFNTDRSVREQIDELTDSEFVSKPCLHRCGNCQHEQFLVVDGEYRSAESHAELLREMTGGCR